MPASSSLPNPLHQFEIVPLLPLRIGSVDVSLTNASLFMLLAVVVPSLFMALSLRRPQLVPGKAQMLCEVLYTFVADMVRENSGEKGMAFFPMVFSLFVFILMGNMLGMIPYAYTFTSQLVVTFTLAMLIFVVVTLVGFARHGLAFLRLFVPKGLPIFLYPLVVFIEVISYLTRPVTLAVRLFANMMAGHTVLKVFAGFSFMLGAYFGFVPGLLNVLLIGFEFMVAGLQAYVFAVLTCIYLHDALYLH